MQPIYTHYDNLKVTRNAPLEVIRAAYKSLSQKYHPDRNLSNPEFARIMTIINTSYEVLSDPTKRMEHDSWIAEKESPPSEKTTPPNTSHAAKSGQIQTNPIKFNSVISHVFRNWVIYAIVVSIAVWINIFNKPSLPPLGPKPYIANPTQEIVLDPVKPAFERTSNDNTDTYSTNNIPVTPVYKRSLYAPNGKLWPVIPSYVQGYKKLHTNGLSSVTVDNTQNDSDVFVKLVSLEGAKTYPVRQFYIPAYSKFTVNKVKVGSYDVRYRDFNSGSLSRSEAFNLEETEILGGTQFSKYTMTLYKVRNGNMQTYSLSESEF